MTSPLRELTHQGRWRPHPQVMVQPMDTATILLHLQTDRFYELNRTATRLWELLTAGHTLAQITAHMLREFAVDPAQLENEINAVMADLYAQGLVIRDA